MLNQHVIVTLAVVVINLSTQEGPSVLQIATILVETYYYQFILLSTYYYQF